MACIYIMAANLSVQNENESVNWIIAKGCEDYDDIQLYVTSFYFIIMTVTTVGYGDLSGFNTPERIICAILQIMGVIIFAISSGSLTSLISK